MLSKGRPGVAASSCGGPGRSLITLEKQGRVIIVNKGRQDSPTEPMRYAIPQDAEVPDVPAAASGAGPSSAAGAGPSSAAAAPAAADPAGDGPPARVRTHLPRAAAAAAHKKYVDSSEGSDSEDDDAPPAKRAALKRKPKAKAKAKASASYSESESESESVASASMSEDSDSSSDHKQAPPSNKRRRSDVSSASGSSDEESNVDREWSEDELLPEADPTVVFAQRDEQQDADDWQTEIQTDFAMDASRLEAEEAEHADAED